MDSVGSKLANQADDSEAIDEFLDSPPELSPRLERLRLLGIDNAQRERSFILGMLMRSVEKSLAEPKFLSSSLCISHTDCSKHSTLVQRHGVETVNYPWQTLKPLTCATVTLPRIPGKSWNESLVFEIDSHLGVSGVIPLSVRQLLPAVPGAGQSLSSINITGFKQTFLREFQAHINFEPLPDSYRSYKAQVSFQSEDGSFGPMVNRISSMIRQLESAISLCQSSGKCLLGIPFLIRAELFPENAAEGEVSIATLAITTITWFFQSFEKFAERCGQQGTKPAEHSPTHANVVETTLSVVLTPSTGLSDLISIAMAITSAASMVSDHWQDISLERDDRQAMDDVCQSLDAIFHTIGFHGGSNISKRLHVILHYSSLAIQCLSLAVQFSARGYVSPIEYSFLKIDVGEFILEGTGFGPEIFACPQSLTCLGAMLKQHVWAFGLGMPVRSSKADLVVYVEDVLSVWGPGQLEIIPQGFGQEYPILGIVPQWFESKYSISYTIGKIFIDGGTLQPRSGSGSLPSWHWESDYIRDTLLSADVMSGDPVDLRTKIRIGVSNAAPPPQVSLNPATSIPTITYPLSFTPIGASRENGLCPHSNWQFDRQRRVTMVTHLKDIGTHEGYNQLAGHDFSVQAGQYVALQRSSRWERRPGLGVKTSLLEETQTLSDLIRMLDKNCGLFVSSCTRVMARARLRDVVAFAGPILYPELFPILRGLNLQYSILELARALQSRDNFLNWAESQLDDQGKVLTSSTTLKRLILRVLGRLKSTGVMPTNAFEVAWLSPGLPPKATRASCASNPWLHLFRDGEFTATFACVTPVCLVTQFHTCTGQRDKPPRCSLSVGLSNFTLSTRVLPYQDLPNKTTGLSQGTPHYATLRYGDKYLLNLATAEITAKVEELITERAYRIKVEEERVISRLVKRLIARREVRFIRESNEDLAFPCLISG